VSIRGGDTPGVRIAAKLAAEGKQVELVEPSGVFAQSLGLPGRWRLVPDLDAAGVALTTEPTRDADTVIDTTRKEPAPWGTGANVTFVGDANPDGIGRLEGANLDVARLALRLRSAGGSRGCKTKDGKYGGDAVPPARRGARRPFFVDFAVPGPADPTKNGSGGGTDVRVSARRWRSRRSRA
jgi:hypothetical protein